MFRDIKRDAFHRSHPMVSAMNASTTPISCLTLLSPPDATTHRSCQTWPTRPGLPPNGYTPNLQLSQNHHYPQTRHLPYPSTSGNRSGYDALWIRLLKDKADPKDSSGDRLLFSNGLILSSVIGTQINKKSLWIYHSEGLIHFASKPYAPIPLIDPRVSWRPDTSGIVCDETKRRQEI